MEAAAGLYTRIVYPDVLAKTDPHLSELQMAMLDATPDCIKVVSPDGTLLTMNRAGRIALGVPDDSEYGMPWLSLLPEEVRPLGVEALREAANGRNARFPGKSVSPEGIHYWDNLLTPMVDGNGKVLSILCVSRDVTTKTTLEQRLEEGLAREQLLAREMQHRIKNLLSVVSGLIVISEKEASETGSSETATKILRDKLGALARASDAVFVQELGGEAGPADVEAVVRSVLQPYRERCSVSGSAASMPRESVTALALFMHELATNSVKYGALRAPDGMVTVNWTIRGASLQLTWTETGGPAIVKAPERQGFGSQMADRAMRSIGGTIQRSWPISGFVAELQLPNFVRGTAA